MRRSRIVSTPVSYSSARSKRSAQFIPEVGRARKKVLATDPPVGTDREETTSLTNAMRDTRTRSDFLGEDYEFDEKALRADTIDDFPRPDSDDPLVHATD